MSLDIEKAIKIIKEGGIVIFPTDTAFGIGCRVDNEDAIGRLFALRKRPETQAMSILVDTVTMAKKYVLEIPQEVVDKLIEPYWPGALTIVLKSKDTVPSLVRGGGKTVGVRIPNHTIARKLIRVLGVGILGPSANFHGEKTPYRYEDLNPELTKLVDYVIPGVCPVGMASTVIDCSKKPWEIVRSGAISVSFSMTKDI